MGFISQMVKASGDPTVFGRQSPTDRGEGRARWRQVFGTTKETVRPQPPDAGGSHGRSLVSTNASVIRLLQALRSMAPGGWSDDRFEQSKHFVGIVYVAIDRLGKQLQRGEFRVTRKDKNSPDGKRDVTEEDPAEGGRMCKPYDLVRLLERPNKQDYFGKMMYRWNQQRKLTGMALTWMVPNQFGIPMELYSIPTAIAIPQPAINPEYPDGYYRIQPIYPYGPFSSYPTPTTAVGAPIPAQWMMRFLDPHPLLRYDGYSTLTGMRLHIDEVEQIDRSRWYKNSRSINPSAVLSFKDSEDAQPLPLPEIERVKVMIEEMFQGPQNHGNLVVCPPGGSLDEFGSKPIDMEYQAGWEQLTDFVLGGGFGITKPAAGMIAESSYAAVFATLKQLHLTTLEPDCQDYGAELTHTLAPFFGDDLVVEVRCPRIDDHELKDKKLQMLIGAKAIKKNTLLKELEFPTTEEEWGEEFAGEGGQEAQQQQGMGMGMPGQEGPPQGGVPDEAGIPEEVDEGPSEGPEVSKTRPNTGSLGEGSLGPRMKGLLGRRRLPRIKSLYQRTREALCNGNGKH